MDEFKLKNFNRFVENFKLKQQKEFKPTVEENVNEVVERLNLPEVKEKLDCAKLKEKELGAFKELSDEEVEQALEKDSNKTKIIETLKKLNFKNISQEPKTEICEVEGAKALPTVDDIEVGAGSGSTKRHVFKSVSFTAGLEYLNSLSVRTTRTTPSVEPPVVIPTNEPTNEPTIPEGAIVLARAASNEVTTDTPSSKTITVTSTPQVIVLKNPFTGKNYMYTVSLSQDRLAKLASDNAETVGFTVPTSSSATFTFTASGRLLINGSYLKVVSSDSANNSESTQIDDIVVKGNYNEISTGKGDDIVRLGYAKESLGSNTNSTNNIVNSGEGNDHVKYYGDNNIIDMGDGDYDTCLAYSSGHKNSATVTNATSSTYRTNNNSVPLNLDGIDGWARQGGQGDCLTLSLINSLTHCQNQTNLYDYIDVQTTGSGKNAEYTVTFKKYYENIASKSSSLTASVNLTFNEVNSTDAAYGDPDTRLFVAALEKLIATNKPEYVTAAANSGYDLLAYMAKTVNIAELMGYILGVEKYKPFYSKNYPGSSGTNVVLSDQRITNLIAHYANGDISNLIIAFSSKDEDTALDNSLGIVRGHAFAIKEYNQQEGYMVLVNPWDDLDYVYITMENFYNTIFHIDIYGYDDSVLIKYSNTPVV